MESFIVYDELVRSIFMPRNNKVKTWIRNQELTGTGELQATIY